MTQQLTRQRINSKKLLLWVGITVLVILLALLGWLYLNPAYAASAKTFDFVKIAVAKQQKIEAELRSYYWAGTYTFTDPMVIQDPYQSAPLTALLVFDTPEASQISVHISGRSSQADVDFSFPGYQRHHEIPVYGLYAATQNHVMLSLKTQAGASAQTRIDLQTEALPVSLPEFRVSKLDAARYSPGFNFTLQKQKPVFDLNGDVRWYSTQASWEVFTPLKNGHFLFTYSAGGVEGNILMEQDLLGKIYAIYNVPDGIHHDIYELPTGNLLITSADLKSATIEDYLIEIDRNSGHIVRSFDLKDILDPGRPHQVAELAANDWLHLNSVVYDPADRSIIISSKGQSAVVKLSYPGMQIKWILGPHDNWSPKYQPYLLSPSGDSFEWPWSQHHATLYTPDTVGAGSNDILLFDNAMYRSFESASAYPTSEWYSRVVHYRINETNGTIQQVWEYGQEYGADIFSAVRGSAYVLSNGNVLGTWGDIYKDAQGNPAVNGSTNGTVETRIIEIEPVTPQTTGTGSTVIFEVSIPGSETYRTFRAGFYDGYSEANTDISTALNDTTGNDLADRSAMAWRDLKRECINPLVDWLKNLRHQILAEL